MQLFSKHLIQSTVYCGNPAYRTLQCYYLDHETKITNCQKWRLLLIWQSALMHSSMPLRSDPPCINQGTGVDAQTESTLSEDTHKQITLNEPQDSGASAPKRVCNQGICPGSSRAHKHLQRYHSCYYTPNRTCTPQSFITIQPLTTGTHTASAITQFRGNPERAQAGRGSSQHFVSMHTDPSTKREPHNRKTVQPRASRQHAALSYASFAKPAASQRHAWHERNTTGHGYRWQ